MNTQPKIKPAIVAVAACMLLGTTGCKYDRSFFDMSSNSGSPFFGLQFAVDSGSRPPRTGNGSNADDSSANGNRQSLQHQRYPAIPEFRERDSSSPLPILLTHFSGSKQKHPDPNSEILDLNSNASYSLRAPISSVSLKTTSIDQRLSAF